MKKSKLFAIFSCVAATEAVVFAALSCVAKRKEENGLSWDGCCCHDEGCDCDLNNEECTCDHQ